MYILRNVPLYQACFLVPFFYIIGCLRTLLSTASMSLFCTVLRGVIVSAFFQKHRYTKYVPTIIIAIGNSPFHQSGGQSPFPAIIGAMVREMMLISLIRMFSDWRRGSNSDSQVCETTRISNESTIDCHFIFVRTGPLVSLKGSPTVTKQVMSNACVKFEFQ